MENDSQAPLRLRSFREEIYGSALGHRKDSLFELMEAALCASAPQPLVQLSTVAVFRRRWPSACDGLADGSLDTTRLRRLFIGALPAVPAEERELWVIDGTTWPRPAAATSPERTYCHRVAPGIPQSGVVPGWESQWLVAVPEQQGSWVLPLDVTRRGPTAGNSTDLALVQLGAVLRSRPAGASRPLVVLDSGYDPVGLASSQVAGQVDFLVRLAKNRVFYHQPGPYRGRGAPRKHGAVFDLKNPATQGEPTRQASVVDPEYGRVEVTLWAGLHTRRAPGASFTGCGSRSSDCHDARPHLHHCGWDGSVARHPKICWSTGAGTCAVLLWSTVSASPSTASAGLRSDHAQAKRRIVGRGWWP